jgi:uncharacterized protein YfdQ (DUF2303 family)
MDQSAIYAIANMALASPAEQLKRVEGVAMVIPKDHQLTSLEHLQEAPDAFKATFKTTVIAEFIRYLLVHIEQSSALFINPENMSAKAVLDLGDPERPLWGRHVAMAALKKIPAYAALLEANDTNFLQQAFIDFAEDYEDNMAFIDSDGLVLNYRQTINTLRTLKVTASRENDQTVGNYAATRSALESIEVTAGNQQLPYGFKFTVIPYAGFEPVTLTAQLRSLNDDKAIRLKFRIQQLEVTKAAIAEAFKVALTDELHNLSDAVYIAEFTYQ